MFFPWIYIVGIDGVYGINAPSLVNSWNLNDLILYSFFTVFILYFASSKLSFTNFYYSLKFALSILNGFFFGTS
jgi:hypothetical protein